MGAMASADLRAARTMIEGEVRAAHGMLEAARVRAASLRDEVRPLAAQALQATIAAYHYCPRPRSAPLGESLAAGGANPRQQFGQRGRYRSRARRASRSRVLGTECAT